MPRWWSSFLPSSRSRRRGAGAGAAVLAWLLSASCAVPPRDEASPPREAEPAVPVEGAPRPGEAKVAVGQPFVDFAAPDLDGNNVRLSDLVRAKVVLLQFWGIRCAPCLAEMEFLSGLQARHGPRGLQVLGVNTDGVGGGQLKKALVSRGLSPTYPNLVDASYAVSTQYTRWLIPVSVLIGRDGLVRAIHTGYRPEMDAEIETAVEALLAN